MPGVTREQIDAAKKIRAIDFLRKYRSYELVPSQCRGEFELRSHDSFKINGESSVWHWKSRDIGGKSALDYLIHVEGVGFLDAVQMLMDEVLVVEQPLLANKPEQREFLLPGAAPDNRRVYAYLLSRGIDRDVIDDCVRAGILYESAVYHNAVFLGTDGSGTPRYTFLRGTYTKTTRHFRAEVAGSGRPSYVKRRTMEKDTLKAYVITDLTAELAVENMDSEYGEDDYAELDGRDLTDYESSVREYIEKEKELLDDGGNLAPYIDESLLRLRENVLRIEPDVVVYEGKLCGCAIVELKQELSERDWNLLLSYISGQYSDGWGEGFEQRDIPVADGILNVHFWQPDQKYPIVLDTLPGQAPTAPVK